MIRFEALYFDGIRSRALPVELAFRPDGTCSIAGAGIAIEQATRELAPGTRMQGAPRSISLPDGARLELADSDDLERCLAAARPEGAGWVARLEAHWLAVTLSLLATIGLLALAVRFAIPELARVAAQALPPALEERLGEETLATLDARLFEPSEMTPEELARVESLFAEVASQRSGDRSARVVVRGGGPIGANAFALPSGIVVVTDELLDLLEDPDQLASVLAHELGHVQHRHGLRLLLQNVGVGVLVAGALGDFVSISALASGVPTLLLQLQYSRRFEVEADDFASELLREAGRPPDALAQALARLDPRGQADSGLLVYLSTHPGSEERARRSAERRASP